MTQEGLAPPSRWQIWWLAARPKTLPAAAAPVIVGSAAAFREGGWEFGVMVAALLAAVLLQIGANFANDVFDFKKGADAHQRLGPVRVTQAGYLSAEQVLLGMWSVFGLAACIGAFLVWKAGWPVMVVGLASIAAAIAYTGGPFPFGYYGLGEFFVFIFFGPVAVCGTYFVHIQRVDMFSLLASLPMGFLITAILVVNNLRDIHSDPLVGKLTLAVRLGEKGTRMEYLLCLLGAYLVPVMMWGFGFVSGWVMLSWITLPLASSRIRLIWRTSGVQLNEALAGTGRLTLAYSLWFSLGMIVPEYLARFGWA